MRVALRFLTVALCAGLTGLGPTAVHAGAAQEPATPAATAPAGVPEALPHTGPAALPLRQQHAQRTGPGGSEAMRAAPPASPDQLALGERIYREGRGEGGRELVGLRLGGIEARGRAVACASCHRRSGLGSVEGVDQVSPIAGRFIFTDDPRAVVSMNFRNIKSFNQKHAAFDAAGFAAAVTRGQGADGRELSPMMPRMELGETELDALAAYLRTLSREWSPGVSASRLRLATVVTPDVTPERREVFLETLRAAVAQKNGNFTPGQRTMSTAAEMLMRSDRFWDLEVWELQGDASTWAAQLDARQQARPVFALVSGLGAGEWGPVQGFCERHGTPCWFPSVDAVPDEAAQGQHGLYFNAGTPLEAEVLAAHLAAAPPARVVQWHRGDAAGRAGARRLSERLAGLSPRTRVLTVELSATDAGALRRAAAALDPQDTLVAWWPGEAIADLGALPLPAVQAIHLSGRLAGAQAERLPGAWKTGVSLVWPWQSADRRAAQLFNFEWWLKSRRIALRDLVLQSEVFFATSYLAETLTDMIDNVHADYLIERAENMLSLREGQKAEDEAREATIARHNKAPGGAQGAMARIAAQPEQYRKSARPLPGQPVPVTAKREGTTVYPRLSLGPGQRFASKGAWLVRFPDADAHEPLPITGWLTP